MTFLEKQHTKRQEELKKLYDPKTAFGNKDLIELTERVQEDASFLSTHKKCPDCGGDGVEECGECGQDKECATCHGEGYVEKTI